jgi:hypothetical protein
LEDYFKVKTKFGVLQFKNGSSFYVGEIIKLADVNFINFKYSFMKMPTDKQLFALFFDTKMYGVKHKRSRYSNDKTFNDCYEDIINNQTNSNVYYADESYLRKVIKQAWLKNKHTKYYLITKRNIESRSSMADISELFNVHDLIVDDNGNLTTYAKTIIQLQDEYFAIIQKHCTYYNDIEVPEDFILKRKTEKISNEIRNTTIPVKFATMHGHSRVKLDELFNSNFTIFYGTKEDETKLNDAKLMFSLCFDEKYIVTYYNEYDNSFSSNNKEGGIMFLIIAQNNIKYMQYCKKAYHIDNFYWKMLYRKHDDVIEFFSNCSIITEYKKLNNIYNCPKFSIVSPDWGNKIIELKNFIDKIDKKYGKYCWNEYQYIFNKYFDINNIKTNPESNKYFKILNELKELQEINSDNFEYIDIPYYIDNAKDSFWNLLKKILIY